MRPPFRLTAPPTASRSKRKPFKLTTRRDAERVQQIDCTAMLKRVLLPEVCFTAIEHSHSWNPTIGRNGQPIGLMEAVRRKAQGVRKGLPDYLFWHASYSYAIEFKDEDGVLGDDQKVFLRELIAAGAFVRVCWNIKQVMDAVYEWRLCRPTVKWEIAA